MKKQTEWETVQIKKALDRFYKGDTTFLKSIQMLLDAQRKEIIAALEKEKPKERQLNKDNPQYVLGWNACLHFMNQAIEIVKNVDR